MKKDLQAKLRKIVREEIDKFPPLKEATNINPETTKLVVAFVKRLAKLYGYSEEDAAFAITTVLDNQGWYDTH